MNIDKKDILSLIETVVVYGEDGKHAEAIARIDSGAAISSIDLAFAEKLELGPILASKTIRSANGKTKRPTIEITIEIKERKIKSIFTVADRNNMKYPILIGQNTLKGSGFLIDPSKSVKD